ncbi:MAG: PqqD family protein [Bacteroidales bacterium]|nr:PqqD family protein [Bacteroidales bacterium]
MRINPNIKIRDMVSEHIVVMPGAAQTDMTRVIALNDSALLLYNALSGRDFELEDAVRVLTDEYDVTPDVARRDAEALLADMRKNDLLV